MAEEPHLQKIIEHFKTEKVSLGFNNLSHVVNSKDSRFMDFLSNLCVCGGRPNPRVQSKLKSKLHG